MLCLHLLRKNMVEKGWNQFSIRLNSLCFDLCALLVDVRILDIDELFIHAQFIQDPVLASCVQRKVNVVNLQPSPHVIV